MFDRFLYEEGSPANQFYNKCLMEMRAEMALRDAGTEADTEDADGDCSFSVCRETKSLAIIYTNKS